MVCSPLPTENFPHFLPPFSLPSPPLLFEVTPPSPETPEARGAVQKHNYCACCYQHHYCWSDFSNYAGSLSVSVAHARARIRTHYTYTLTQSRTHAREHVLDYNVFLYSD